jgi:hypothetical protein
LAIIAKNNHCLIMMQQLLHHHQAIAASSSSNQKCYEFWAEDLCLSGRMVILAERND